MLTNYMLSHSIEPACHSRLCFLQTSPGTRLINSYTAFVSVYIHRCASEHQEAWATQFGVAICVANCRQAVDTSVGY